MIDVGWAERYNTMKKQIMRVTALVGWAYYWSQTRYLSWQVVTDLIGLTVYQIKKAPKAAIEEADSADKRNKGSQEVNEQIEWYVVLSM